MGFNAGEAAGQTVPHLHIHVIPRYKGDRHCVTPVWTAGKSYPDRHLSVITVDLRFGRETSFIYGWHAYALAVLTSSTKDAS